MLSLLGMMSLPLVKFNSNSPSVWQVQTRSNNQGMEGSPKLTRICRIQTWRNCAPLPTPKFQFNILATWPKAQGFHLNYPNWLKLTMLMPAVIPVHCNSIILGPWHLNISHRHHVSKSSIAVAHGKVGNASALGMSLQTVVLSGQI